MVSERKRPKGPGPRGNELHIAATVVGGFEATGDLDTYSNNIGMMVR